MSARPSGADYEEEKSDANDPYYCEMLEEALRQAAMVFGEPVVEALVTALKEKYGIRLGPSSLPCSSLAEIESAMTQIADSGAEILINRMRSILDKEGAR